jgi:hypothetical protein
VWHAVTRLSGAIVLLGLAITTHEKGFEVLTPSVFAQPRDVMSEARVRELVRQAAREAKGEPTETILDLDRRVRARW